MAIDCVFKATPARRPPHCHMNSIGFDKGGESFANKAGARVSYVVALNLPQLWRPISQMWDRRPVGQLERLWLLRCYWGHLATMAIKKL